MSTPAASAPTSRARLALPALYFAHFSAFGVFLPFLPVWLVARGIDGPALGLTLAAPYVVGVAAPILLGALADALGLRARMLGFAAGLSLVAAAFMGAAAVVLPSNNTRTVLLAMLISALAFARTSLFGLTDVLALETLGDDRARFGGLRLWGSAGFLFAAVAFPIAFDPDSAAGLPLVMMAAYFVTLLVARALPSSSAKLGLNLTATAELFTRHAGFFLVMLLWQLGNATYDSTFTLHLTDLGLQRVWLGVAWGIGVIAEILLMALTPVLLARWRPRSLLLIGLGIAMMRWFLIAVVRSPSVLLAAQVLHAGSFALTWTIASIELPRVASGRLATAQGALATTLAIGSALGMLVWPVLYRDVGAQAVFAGGGVVTLLALLVLAMTDRSSLSRGSSYSPRSP